MIKIRDRFDVFTAILAYVSVILMCFTFVGIFLNGEKVWVEPNKSILVLEMLIFLVGFVILSIDFWSEVYKVWNR